MIIGGGPVAIIAILLLVILYFYYDRSRLIADANKLKEDVEAKNAKLEKIIDDYYKGHVNITDALNGLKMVLIEIKAKL